MQKVHQGDVLLIECEIPVSAKKTGENIVQHGEITGHCHEITGAVIYADEKDRYVKVTVDNSYMTHPDHPAIPVKKKSYKIHVQKEFFPSVKNGVEGFYKPVQD